MAYAFDGIDSRRGERWPTLLSALLAAVGIALSSGAEPGGDHAVAAEAGGMALVAQSGDDRYSLYAEPASEFSRAMEPRLMELRTANQTLWSKRVSPGLWKALVTDRGAFLGCFWRGAPVGEFATLQLLDASGTPVVQVLLKTQECDPGNDPDPVTFAIAEDDSAIWLLDTRFRREPPEVRLVIVKYSPGNADGVETTVQVPGELADCEIGNIVAVPGASVVAIMHSKPILEDRDPLTEHDVFFAFFDVDEGRFLGVSPAMLGVDPKSARRLLRVLPEVWGVESGMAMKIDGPATEDRASYAIVTFSKDQNGAYHLTTRMVATEQELGERQRLPVARRILN